MNILTVKGLCKQYDDFTAVKDLNFSLAKGEIFGFLGPNGAGKTTTINMLTGLARVSAGAFMMAGIDGVKNIKRAQRMIGTVPDESNLYDEMSGFANLSFCASLYGIGKKEREDRARELLKIFGLAHTGKKPFKAYSKGMKRKLTIAAGIIHHPPILFLDEPTSGIDVESARQIRHLIQDLNRQGTTIFLTTHYIEEAERLCRRIGFIVQGEIIKIGVVEELIQDAQAGNAVRFSLTGAKHITDALESEFADITFDVTDDSTITIYSAEPITLAPFINFFEKNRIPVHEARIVRPSLEDIFVTITGIGIDVMRKEKEGGGRRGQKGPQQKTSGTAPEKS